MNKQTIFWVDDDPDDLELFYEVLSELANQYTLHKFYNGREAMDYLENLQGFQFPCLIILDMNMPVMDGRQTLAALKSDSKYRNIPVVVFTTSSSETDRMFCAHHNTAMITKPPQYDKLKEVVQNLLSYCEG